MRLDAGQLERDAKLHKLQVLSTQILKKDLFALRL